ncbi:tRNA lysidine(34) synthetase TilS [Sphingobium sp. AN558]|uniref:tRNA lysidine(34) synthetase TilS n=1 Tax=Sphingobium sp. AN558 TaxID=3133442 RepID=UPI0030BC2452
MLAATRAIVGDVTEARFGVAVSGGPDSMALLDLAAGAFPGRTAAATVDHGLRPESASEAAMVGRWCGERSIPHTILHPATAVTGNVQNWARAQRYALLEDWRASSGIDWIMTAHHADDQLETMLMRLNRGAGVGGLAGVRARSGQVIRPLLGMRKAALLDYGRTHNLPFVSDPSNDDPRFDRAALRSVLEPVAWLDRAAAGRSAAALGEADAALQWTAEELAARHVSADGDGWVLDRTDLPRELLRRLLLLMLVRGAPLLVPRGESIDRALAMAGAGKKCSLGDWVLEGGVRWSLRPAPRRR